MNYCIKFSICEVFANSYHDAITCAVSLAKQFDKVVIWQGTKIVWHYDSEFNRED